jgi:hypothetical protein
VHDLTQAARGGLQPEGTDALKKEAPLAAGLIGRLLACLWRSVSALLVVI